MFNLAAGEFYPGRCLCLIAIVQLACLRAIQSPDAQELAVKTVSMLDAENVRISVHRSGGSFPLVLSWSIVHFQEHLVNMISEAEAKCEQLDKLVRPGHVVVPPACTNPLALVSDMCFQMKRQLAAFEVEKAKLLSASSSHSTTSSNIQVCECME